MKKRPEIAHEAGHAIMFWYYGFALSKVTVQPEPAAGNVAGYCKALAPDFGNTAGHVFALAAGRAAMEIYCPAIPSGNSHSFDFETIKKMALPGSAILAMHQWRLDNPSGSMEQFYQEFKKPVIKVLKSKPARRAMSALSKSLGKAGTLSGATAAAIILKAWGDPPPALALPVEKHMGMTDKGPQCLDDLIRSIQTYIRLMQADIKGLRDAGTEEENERLERIWQQIVLLKVLV